MSYREKLRERFYARAWVVLAAFLLSTLFSTVLYSAWGLFFVGALNVWALGTLPSIVSSEQGNQRFALMFIAFIVGLVFGLLFYFWLISLVFVLLVLACASISCELADNDHG